VLRHVQSMMSRNLVQRVQKRSVNYANMMFGSATRHPPTKVIFVHTITYKLYKSNIMDAHQDKSPESFKITGSWSMLSKKLKSRFTQLTESDLKFEFGKEDDMVARIAKRLNKNTDEVIQLLNAAQVPIPNAL
jgi:hypothetical protein